MKKVLITGSSGFIGSYFVNRYKNRYEIKSFSFLRDDINSLNCNGVDVVLHLSGLVHKMGGATKEEYEKANVTQTLELAKKAKNSGVRQFIFMSTVKACGEESDEIYTENTKCNPIDEYGKSKLKAEIELQKLEDDDFKISIVRTPIVYGYGVKANMRSLINVIDRVSILPLGGIDNRRSMVYVGNLSHLVDTIIDREKKGVFLAGDDEYLSTTKLCELIAQNLNKKIYLVKIPFLKIFLKLFKPSFYKRIYGNLEIDNTITKETLMFKNIYSVEEGIKYMIKGEDI